MTRVLALLLLLSVASFQANSQNPTDSTKVTTVSTVVTNDSTWVAKNLVKMNLSSLFLGNYVVQYERVIGKKSSLAFAVGYAPNAELPFKETLMDNFGDNETAKKAIESTVYTRWTYTLEYRYYLGKAAPKGLYLAPFIRGMNMELEQDYPFTPSDGLQHVATVSSKFNAFGGGLMLGAQWLPKKHWGVDFWIIGAYYGSNLDAKFHGTDPIGGLTQQDMVDLEDVIEGVDLPGYTIDATVTQHPSGKPTIVDATLTGNWYGFRGAGICLVYRF